MFQIHHLRKLTCLGTAEILTDAFEHLVVFRTRSRRRGLSTSFFDSAMTSPQMLACDVYWLDGSTYTRKAESWLTRREIEEKLPQCYKIQKAARLGRRIFCIL